MSTPPQKKTTTNKQQLITRLLLSFSMYFKLDLKRSKKNLMSVLASQIWTLFKYSWLHIATKSDQCCFYDFYSQVLFEQMQKGEYFAISNVPRKKKKFFQTHCFFFFFLIWELY